MAKITRMKKTKDRVAVELDTGDEVMIGCATANRLGWAEGGGVSEAEVLRAAREDEEARARDKVLRLLERRAYPRRDLLQRLRRAGFTEAAAAAVIDRLVAAGAVDDGAFARAWIRTRLVAGPQGRRRLTAELARRGVDRETAAAALAEESPGDENDACLRAAERQAVKYRRLPAAAARRRLSAFLARRGFDPEDVRRAVERIRPGTGDDTGGCDAGGPEGG